MIRVLPVYVLSYVSRATFRSSTVWYVCVCSLQSKMFSNHTQFIQVYRLLRFYAEGEAAAVAVEVAAGPAASACCERSLPASHA